ncbi:retrovirus-related pol polyprotein from transposon TNT 1-94 [Tanacetum coccineum]
MDFDKYLKEKSMQRAPLFESDGFIYWKNRFETYVKSKDLDLWHVITNGNSQVKDKKIDLLVQQYEQFVILEDESIDNDFARFNTITTSLKALDEGNLKVHEESSDEESSTSESEGEEYAMAVRDFKKFFKRRDAETQIISSENVQNCRETRTNGLLLEVFGVTAVRKMMKRPKTKTCLMAQASSKHDGEMNKDGKVIGRGIRKSGLYVLKLGNKPKDKICLTTIDENSTLWHRRLGHANMHLIQSLASKELVRNSHNLKFDQHFYDACKIGKQAHASHKAKNMVSTTICLELLHMDLFGPSVVVFWSIREYWSYMMDNTLQPELVPQPNSMTVIGTKWVFRNKIDKNGIVSRNKARLVAQGYNQQEDIDYDETYAPVAD